MLTTNCQVEDQRKKNSPTFLNQYYTQIFDIKSNGTIVAVGDDPREGGDVIANQLKLIVDNARAYNPVLIDSTGKNTTYSSLNANYTMDGTES